MTTKESGEQKDIARSSGTGIPKNTFDRRLPGRLKEKTGINLRDYLSLFFKRKKIILISFVTFILLASLYPLLIYQPKYRASSILLVKFGWENLSPDLLPGNRGLPAVNQREIIQSEVNILKSRESRERVVNALRPENIFPELVRRPYAGMTNSEAAVSLLDRDLTITPEKGNTISVVFSGANPERASAVVNQLVDSFIERRSEIYKDPKSVLFLEKKADEFAHKLADAEARLQAFREETNIVSFDEQRVLLIRQQYDLKHDLSVAESDKKATVERIGELEKQMNSIPRFSATSEDALSYRVQGTEQKILDLQLLERELAAKYKDDNKLLIGARERLKIAADFMEKQRQMKPAELVDPTWQELQKQQFAAKAETVALNAQIEAIEGRLRDLNTVMQNFDALEEKNKGLVQEVADNAEKYKTYRQRVEDARVFDELNRQKMTSVSVIDRASPSNVPTNPFRPLFIFIPVVLAVAVIGSLAVAYLVEMLSYGLSTPSEAEKRLELPVLATIAVK